MPLGPALICIDSSAPLVFLPHIALSDPLVRVMSHPAADEDLLGLLVAAVAASY
jgi:hypothetical protein